MPKQTLVFAALLIAVGVGAYLVSGSRAHHSRCADERVGTVGEFVHAGSVRGGLVPDGALLHRRAPARLIQKAVRASTEWYVL